MKKPCLLTAPLELQIYERVDMFRQQIGNLDLTVGIYNSVQRTMLNVEKPLILQKIEAVDAALKKGLAVSPGPDLVQVALQCVACSCQLQDTAVPLHSASHRSGASLVCRPGQDRQPSLAICRCSIGTVIILMTTFWRS